MLKTVRGEHVERVGKAEVKLVREYCSQEIKGSLSTLKVGRYIRSSIVRAVSGF